jgi:hypothetical protein
MRPPETALVAHDRPEIGRLRQSVQALVDADLLLMPDGQWLLAILEEAVQSLAAAELAEAQAGFEGFIDRVRLMIQGDVLTAADGRPPIETAQAILASLGGEEPPACGKDE